MLSDVCVLGLGYIGLPTAAMLASAGLRVLGVDINEAYLAALSSPEWQSPERGLAELVHGVIGDGRLTLATAPAPAQVYIIAVPTPVTGQHEPDLSYVERAAEMLLPHLRPGVLVVLESTVAPGTTERLLLPILLRSGLALDRDLFVAHAPERVLPGNLLAELVANDRIVGGATAESARRAQALYRRFVQGDILISDATTAELVKLMENSYRDLNIALANEFACMAEEIGVDVWQAISLANRHPRVRILQPGPGVGGHCLAVDPWFLAAAAPHSARLIPLGRQVNDGMADHVVSLVTAAVAAIPDPQITVAGLAYKADVTDARESPAERIVEQLGARGLRVVLSDPWTGDTNEFTPVVSSLAGAVCGSDVLLVLTDHAEYRELDAATLAKLAAAMRRPLVIDTRNCLDRARWEAAGFTIRVLGIGTPAREPVPA